MFFFPFLENSINLCNKVLFTSEGNKQVTATVLRHICSFLSGYIRSQVCLGRQVNHHVYLQPVLGTDQTFAFPASPCVAPFSLSFSLPPLPACRRGSTPSNSTRDNASSQRKRGRLKASIEVSVCGSVTSCLSPE